MQKLYFKKIRKFLEEFDYKEVNLNFERKQGSLVEKLASTLTDLVEFSTLVLGKQ